MDDPPPTGPDCDCDCAVDPPGSVPEPGACPHPDRIQLSRRDCAILRAVAEGRCMVSAEFGTPLTVDGFVICDQFTVARLGRAGLITAAGPAPTPAILTAEGQALLRVA